MTGCDPNAVVHQVMGSRKLGMTYLIMRNWHLVNGDLEIEGERKKRSTSVKTYISRVSIGCNKNYFIICVFV